MKILSWNVGLTGKIFRKVMCIFETKLESISNICHRILKKM